MNISLEQWFLCTSGQYFTGTIDNEYTSVPMLSGNIIDTRLTTIHHDT